MADQDGKKESCKHPVWRPSGKIYHVPGQEIDGAESFDCFSCHTSRALHIRPFEFPQLKKNKPT